MEPLDPALFAAQIRAELARLTSDEFDAYVREIHSLTVADGLDIEDGPLPE
ncbi:MAG: hypothetical protein ACLGHX_13485 [Acidimicrobiia bacterium]